MANEDYNDIINLPYKGKTGGGLSMYQRAAQFAPFAALTGHDAAIRETARLTDSQIELGDDHNEIMNRRLAILRDHLKDTPEVAITFFQPDSRKAGGAYEIYTGCIKGIDDYEQFLIMKDGKKISIPSILDIDSQLFDDEI